MAAEDRVYFLAKDPEWAWIGWRLSGAVAVPDQARLTLRVWDLNAGYPSPPFFDVEVVGVTDHRYLHLDPSGHSHLVQLGFTEADGTFRMVAQSSPVTMPPAGPAAVTDERWSAPAGRPEASTGREKGYLVIVLNAHLPYLHHLEEDYPAEEDWLYENLIESYIPLLRMISKLADGGVRSGLTVFALAHPAGDAGRPSSSRPGGALRRGSPTARRTGGTDEREVVREDAVGQ